MPPKKKEEPKQDDAAEDGADRGLVEMELVLSYLKSKLGRYQEQSDQLQIENIKLAEDLENEKLTLRDVNEFLQNELKARSITANALESKVYELSNMLEDNKKTHENALGKLRAEKDREVEALRNRLEDFERKAKAMQDFLDRKDAMEAELAACKAELAAKIKDYEYKLTDLDRSHIQDREKWKRETMQKIKETKIQMMKLTDNQLEMTTKRTIMENVQMSIELQYQSRQTEKLMNKNIVLLEENQDLRQQLSLSKQTQEELARRNNVYQKTIKSLLTKLKEQGEQQEAIEPMTKGLEERIADLELQLHLSDLQAQEQTHKIETLQQRLDTARAVNEAVAASQDATVRFLTQCLEEAKSKIVTVIRQDSNTDHQRNSSGSGAHPLVPAISTVSEEPRRSSYLLESQPTSRTDVSSVYTGGGLSRAASHRHGGAHHVHMAAPAMPSETPKVPAVVLSVETGRLEDLNPEQRERVLSYLLEKMHVYMHQQAMAAAAAEHGGGEGSSLLLNASSARFGRRASARHSSARRVSSQGNTLRNSVAGASGLARMSLATCSESVSGLELQGSQASPAASWPAPGHAQRGAAGTTGAGQLAIAKPGVPLAEPVAALPIPSVDDLLLKVMADVRPWGKKTADSPIVGTAGSTSPARQRGNTGNNSVFVQKDKPQPVAGRRKQQQQSP